MEKIAIYGAGGFGREVACLIRMINSKNKIWDFIGFFDDGKPVGFQNEYGEILGGIQQLNSFEYPLNIVIAIGHPSTAKEVVSKIKNNNVSFPNLFSPDVIYLDKENIQFGKGNIVTVGCSFSCNVKIGDFNVFNGFIAVGHDTSLGNFNSMMTSVKIAGEVSVGNENYFGSSSVVLQQIKIGNKTTIGANSTIMRNTKDGNTYIGTPAIKVKF